MYKEMVDSEWSARHTVLDCYRLQPITIRIWINQHISLFTVNNNDRENARSQRNEIVNENEKNHKVTTFRSIEISKLVKQVMCVATVTIAEQYSLHYRMYYSLTREAQLLNITS
jgi:hypothetical protein